MNILLIFPHYNEMAQGGSLRSSQIGNYLGARGHKVTVFAPGVILRTEKRFAENKGRVFYKRIRGNVRLIRPWCLENFRRSPLKRLMFEINFALLTFIRCLFININKVDIIVIAYPPAVAPAFLFFFAKLFRKPVIYEVRDLMAESLDASGYVRIGFFVRFILGVENFISRHCDCIIAVTNGIKKNMVNRGVQAEKIIVNTNGFEPIVFESADYSFDARKEFGWGDRFVVVYAGGLTQSYDIPTMLRAAQRLKDYRDILFSIIGHGHRKTEYKKYCREHDLTNCQFIDPQPRDRMPAILTRANLGVNMFNSSPLWTIVLGNKTFDYLGSGLPMLYAGQGDTAELILEANGGKVVPPEDDARFAESVLWFYKNPDEGKKMGQNGKKYVRTFYNRDDLLEKLEEAILRHLRK